MGQLHEILAVESSLGKASDKLLQESKKTLDKENLFTGMVRKLEMFDAEKSNLNTQDEMNLESTVDENLDYLIEPVSSYWDAVLQKDLTNQVATGDVVVDGITIASNVPATFLLGLESKLGELRKVYERIHTLPPGYKWDSDTNFAKPGVYVTKETDTFKTEKIIDFVTVAEATEHHPAQVRDVAKTVNVGKYDTTRWSGLLTPLDKAMRLKRIDKLIHAVKKARQRANKAEIVSANIGNELFNYINKG